MNQDSYYVLGLLILVYFLVTLILANRFLLFGGLKSKSLNEEEIKSKVPYLISLNTSFLLSNFILFDTLINMVTFKLGGDHGFMSYLSWSSVVLIVNACTLLASYLITLFVMKIGLRLVNSIIFSIIWLCLNSIIVMLFNFVYIQISKNEVFNIF
ncbi:hypothetical protein [Seonamhaeicola sp. ML3]|uniref:hypothetical protein n=1 Tax=Seonamhaeicola sp. ML3 TaxID=2937786 RepID=UPI00200D73C5|nr:hypothetical protein [Seonamhaeicola sp. ML3]